MAREDLALAQRDHLCDTEGFKTYARDE